MQRVSWVSVEGHIGGMQGCAPAATSVAVGARAHDGGCNSE
jgi:hypothetical protein